MTGYAIIPIAEVYEQLGEEKCVSILSQFSCHLNKDVEAFIRDKGKVLEFTKQGISITYIVMASYREKPVLVGYFTIANKFISVRRDALSKTLQKRIRKFTSYDEINKAYRLSAPLIAQLGKNYTNNYNELISGDELLKMACDKIAEAQKILGGKIVYLECEDCDKLIRFYEDNGFVVFGKRPLEKDEEAFLKGKHLLQLLKYLR